MVEQIMIQRAFRYRLYPTKSQADLMAATANARRFVWNIALEQRRDFWRQAKASGSRITYVNQARELTELRRECDWLSAVHVTPLQQTLRDLDRAFSSFFSGRARYPRFQSKDGPARFRHAGREVSLEPTAGRYARIRVPKVGWVKLRLTRHLRGRTVNVTFSRDVLGWHASFVCEIEHEAAESNLPAVGIDRGVANTLALSTGEMMSTPDVARLERRKRKAQRILARRQRGSSRYRKQRVRVARLSAKISRVRCNWQHEVSTEIARKFGTVVLEDLRIKNMVRGNRGLARSIHEQGWNAFAVKLVYKLEERGGALVKVSPAYSSQTCAACGVVDKASRESQSRFACRHCGTVEHADTNAAQVILSRSSAVVEGSGYAPVEARTNHALAA